MKKAIKKMVCLSILIGVILTLGSYAAWAEVTGCPAFQQVTMPKTTMHVSWYKVKGVDGYEIKYSKHVNYANAKVIRVKGANHIKKDIKGLSKNKDYYVKVRAYVKEAKKIRYSRWNAGCRIVSWNNDWEFAGYSQLHKTPGVLYYAKKTKAKGVTVAINAGHGSVKSAFSKYNLCHPDGSLKVTDGSTAEGSKYAYADSYGAENEAKTMLRLAKKTKTKLLKQGYDVLMIRQTEGIKLDVIGRTVMANNIANCHISLHSDGTASNKGAFYCSVPKIKKYRAMYPVSKHYLKHNRLGKSIVSGLKRQNVKIFKERHIPLDLMQTSYSTIPSTDIEVGDRATKYTQKRMNKMAEGIVAGVGDFFKK